VHRMATNDEKKVWGGGKAPTPKRGGQNAEIHRKLVEDGGIQRTKREGRKTGGTRYMGIQKGFPCKGKRAKRGTLTRKTKTTAGQEAL